ncbi:hypothetical protein JCM10213v2_001951 [Rhodosporidiobolus nylandii]
MHDPALEGDSESAYDDWIQQKALEFQRHTAALDDFVDSLLQSQVDLEDEIAQTQSARAVEETPSLEQGAEEEAWATRQAEKEGQMRKAEEGLQAERERRADALTRAEEASTSVDFCDSRRAELEARQRTAQAHQPTHRKLPGGGPARAVVLINGNSAAFADYLIQRGLEGGKEASKALRDGVTHYMYSADPLFANPEISVFLVHDHKTVGYELTSAQIISAPSTFAKFIDGFSRDISDKVIDVAGAKPTSQLADLYKLFGMLPSVQQIYLVGIDGSGELAHELQTDATAEWYSGLQETLKVQVEPKVVLVDVDNSPNRPSAASGPALVQFGSLFQSSLPPARNGCRTSVVRGTQAAGLGQWSQAASAWMTPGSPSSSSSRRTATRLPPGVQAAIAAGSKATISNGKVQHGK